jgi:hypothetical protein
MHVMCVLLVTRVGWNPYNTAAMCAPYTAALLLRQAVWWLEYKRGWRAPPALHSALGVNLGFILHITRLIRFLPMALYPPGACLADEMLAMCRLVLRVKRRGFGGVLQAVVLIAEGYPVHLVLLTLPLRLAVWVGVFKAIGSPNPLVESIEDTAMMVAVLVVSQTVCLSVSAAWSRGRAVMQQGKKKDQGSNQL